MVAIGAILVAALGAATTAGIATARGELAIGRMGGMQAMRMSGEGHGMGYQMGAEARETMRRDGRGGGMRAGHRAEMHFGANMGAGAGASMQPLAPQWLMVAGGLIRAVASLVPLALIV
ncbi:MAG: hypothetical protein O3B38_02785, partial [Chloroflexi bacterium]|nr:hypothetical protein [Chloroflexota bacterium]